ncbi:hypothetical protein M514_27192 [Trichuris suis]|uniref:Uncharacterized protein n=1 Tax=Trichuris suis TaxID=68888 RepID=A0A085MTS3_9BILA|nr:hypothetical protein M514_27192 [Trichuris suis]
MLDECILAYGLESPLCQRIAAMQLRQASIVKKTNERGGKALFVRFGRSGLLEDRKLKRKNEFIRFG